MPCNDNFIVVKIAADSFLFETVNADLGSFVCYYKSEQQLLQIGQLLLLQIRAAITNRGDYCKLLHNTNELIWGKIYWYNFLKYQKPNLGVTLCCLRKIKGIRNFWNFLAIIALYLNAKYSEKHYKVLLRYFGNRKTDDGKITEHPVELRCKTFRKSIEKHLQWIPF